MYFRIRTINAFWLSPHIKLKIKRPDDGFELHLDPFNSLKYRYIINKEITHCYECFNNANTCSDCRGAL